MEEYLVLDIETLGVRPWDGEILCVSAICGTADGAEDEGVWPFADLPQYIIDAIASPEIALVSHSDYDPYWFQMLGYKVGGPIHNTMVMAHRLNENTNLDLEFCASHYCNIQMDKRISRSEKKIWFTTDDNRKLELEVAWAEVPEQIQHYCLRDTQATHKLYLELRSRLKRGLWERFWLEEEVPYSRILLDMECRGIPIDIPAAEKLKAELEVEACSRESSLLETLGYEVNLGSPKQLRQVLFTNVWKQEAKLPVPEKIKSCLPKAVWSEFWDSKEDMVRSHSELLPSDFEVVNVGREYIHGEFYRKGMGLEPTPPTEKTKEPSTRTGDLLVKHGDNEFVRDLLAYRKVDKVIGTYLEAYPRFTKEGRLYGKFNQAGTVTGRLSSSSPNLENQPAHGPLGVGIRNLFRGHFIIGDHSQLEPRLMAHFSGDPVLLDVYRNNRDIYLVTAARIFGRTVSKEEDERQLCKTLILALGYGAGDEKVAQILCINGYPTTPDRAAEYMAHLKDLYKVFFGWKRYTIAVAKDQGYVKTVGGSIRRLKWAFGNAKWKARNKGERQAVNSIIQGSAADILRRNMLHTQNLEGIYLLNQVHDELIWEVPNSWHSIQPDQLKYMCERPGYKLDVPLNFEPEYCNSWADKGSGFIEIPEDWTEDEYIGGSDS